MYLLYGRLPRRVSRHPLCRDSRREYVRNIATRYLNSFAWFETRPQTHNTYMYIIMHLFARGLATGLHCVRGSGSV